MVQTTSTKQTNRVAIMAKPRVQIGVISMDLNFPVIQGLVNVVSSLDPRCNPATHHRSFKTPEEAEKQFLDALATSRDRGWTVAWIGSRNFG